MSTAVLTQDPIVMQRAKNGSVQYRDPQTGKAYWIKAGDADPQPSAPLPVAAPPEPEATGNPAMLALKQDLTEQKEDLRRAWLSTSDVKYKSGFKMRLDNMDHLLDLVDDAIQIAPGTRATFGNHLSKIGRHVISGYTRVQFHEYRLTTDDPMVIASLRRLVKKGEPGFREIAPDKRARFAKGDNEFLGWLSDADAVDMRQALRHW